MLKLKQGTSEHYHSLYANLIAFTPGPYSTVVVGYPGKYINLPQKLERFDATAYAIGSLSENGIPACAEDEYANICGWRYSTVRRYYDFKEYYGYYTDLGIETETIKGGFSGSPVFFKGNLIGLLTHGKTREQLDIDNVGIWTEVDVADVLSSRDVVRFLEKKGFYF